MTERQEGEFLFHTGCLSCTSSDGLAIYQKEVDGKKIIDGTCFVCRTYFNPKQVEEAGVEPVESSQVKNEVVDFSNIEQLEFRGWKDRGITNIVTAKYGVHTQLKDKSLSLIHI